MRSVLFIPLFLFLFFSGCSNSLSTPKSEVGTTQFHFILPEQQHVKFWLENSYQTTVKILADEIKPMGTHSYEIKMENSNGDPFPYGIYTYRLKTKEYDFSRSIIYSPDN